MSPRGTTALALIGILLAGIPLPALTGTRREVPTAARAAQETPPRAMRQVYATLQCSGQPAQLSLRHEGRELARLGAEELAHSPVELELELPASDILELELVAVWPENEQAQAVSLTLEPEGLPSRQCTHWTDPGDNSLHTLFGFTW